MKRSFLRYFYVGVQFVMLAVSIPKVAMLFHAYDTHAFGGLIGGIDIVSWAIGIAVDFTATFTTWAAMAKYEESRRRSALFAPGLIILFCSGLSVVANYEDAATQAPAQYAGVSLFTHPALLVNPALISAPPILVLLLILLVPSVLARPRVKTAQEIAAETAEQLALIDAQAQLKERRAIANAKVRDARLDGMVGTASALAKRAGMTKDEPALPVSAPESEPESEPESVVTGESGLLVPPPTATTTTANTRMSKAMWNLIPLKERVSKSGLITAPEVAEVLGVKATRGRELVGEAKEAKTEDMPVVAGRPNGVSPHALIDTLYAKRSHESFAQAQKLERALGLRKRATKVLHIVPEDEPAEAAAEAETEVEA